MQNIHSQNLNANILYFYAATKQNHKSLTYIKFFICLLFNTYFNKMSCKHFNVIHFLIILVNCTQKEKFLKLIHKLVCEQTLKKRYSIKQEKPNKKKKCKYFIRIYPVALIMVIYSFKA